MWKLTSIVKQNCQIIQQIENLRKPEEERTEPEPGSENKMAKYFDNSFDQEEISKLLA